MRSWHAMKDIKSSKGGKGPIPHLKKLLIFDRRMLKELACVGEPVYVSLYAFIWGVLLWFVVISTMTSWQSSNWTNVHVLAHPPSADIPTTWGRKKNKQKQTDCSQDSQSKYQMCWATVGKEDPRQEMYLWQKKCEYHTSNICYPPHPPRILWLHMTANKAVVKISRKMRAIHLSMKIINHRL